MTNETIKYKIKLNLRGNQLTIVLLCQDLSLPLQFNFLFSLCHSKDLHIYLIVDHTFNWVSRSFSHFASAWSIVMIFDFSSFYVLLRVFNTFPSCNPLISWTPILVIRCTCLINLLFSLHLALFFITFNSFFFIVTIFFKVPQFSLNFHLHCLKVKIWGL